MTTPDEILAVLRADMRAAKERGARFIEGDFGDGKTTCCALSAGGPLPTISYDIHCQIKAASRRLGITLNEAFSIVLAYDGNPCSQGLNPAFHAIGATLRAEFPPQGNGEGN